jgi:uncharacterized protein involved in exopolysaccharide biosynthesis
MEPVPYQLIESETLTAVLANAKNEYIFKTVDPEVVPQEKSGPKRSLVAIVATMLGAILGVLGYLFEHLFVVVEKRVR